MSSADPAEISIFLQPGKLFCAAKPSTVSTILGSCVAVCLWDACLRIGGINHYVLPHSTDAHHSARFGNVAISQLIDGMMQLGCRPGGLRAKLFGGAEVLPFGADGDTVGNQNVRIALELMRHHCIPILTRCTGGHTGIMIRFITETGDVVVRHLSAAGLAQTPYPTDFAVSISSKQHVGQI